MATEAEEWLTLEQVCKELQISQFTLYRLRKAGKINDHFPGGRRPVPGAGGSYTVRIARSELNRFMASTGQ